MKEVKTITQSRVRVNRPQEQRYSGTPGLTGRLHGIKRITPFLLLSVFLIIFLFPYIIITHGRNIEHAGLKLFLIPFIAANTLYMDISMLKFFEGKKKGFIWIFETIVSALIVYWLI